MAQQAHPKVDAYIARSQKWPREMAALRPILLRAGLAEDIKWGKPCYNHDDKNIAIMQEMKDFLALMFFKGALLSDPSGQLQEQGTNSRSTRRLDRDHKLRSAFESLTPGRRREYNLHIGDAKQAATRESRIDKCVPKIFAGKGFRDR